MIITNCPRCGAMNVTTTCNKCGWSQFTKSTVSTGVLLDDYKWLLLENRNLKERIAELEAEQARWVPVSERLPNISGWYRVGAIDVFYEGYTDEVYFYADKTDSGWKTTVRDEIYCWLDGVPELPQPPEVQQ